MCLYTGTASKDKKRSRTSQHYSTVYANIDNSSVSINSLQERIIQMSLANHFEVEFKV